MNTCSLCPPSDAPVVVVGAGQSGLAAARALGRMSVPTVILEAGDRPVGSWPHYYDSLRLFSPAAFSAMRGMSFRGNPDRYPGRDEVADYLERYAATIPVEIQSNTRVRTVRQDDGQFTVLTSDSRQLQAGGIVAASGCGVDSECAGRRRSYIVRSRSIGSYQLDR